MLWSNSVKHEIECRLRIEALPKNVQTKMELNESQKEKNIKKGEIWVEMLLFWFWFRFIHLIRRSTAVATALLSVSRMASLVLFICCCFFDNRKCDFPFYKASFPQHHSQYRFDQRIRLSPLKWVFFYRLFLQNSESQNTIAYTVIPFDMCIVIPKHPDRPEISDYIILSTHNSNLTETISS